MNWRTISYDWPQAAILLLFVFVIGWTFFALSRYRRNKLNHFFGDAHLSLMLVKREPGLYWTKVVLCCIVWTLGVIALMQPKGNEHYLTRTKVHATYRKAHDVILLMDASASMGVGDLTGGRTRDQVAKEIADLIVSKLNGESVTLWAFTSVTMQLVPLTTDYLFTRLMIRQVEINEGETAGTNIQQALEVIKKQYEEDQIPKTLVLLTDGGDTQLETLQGSARTEYIEKTIHPFTLPEKQNWRIKIVALGSTTGGVVPQVQFQGQSVKSTLDLSLLEPLSQINGNHLFDIDKMTSMQIAQEIVDDVSKRMDYAKEGDFNQQEESDHIYDLYFQIPLGIALVALALFLLIPDSKQRRKIKMKVEGTKSTALSAGAQLASSLGIIPKPSQTSLLIIGMLLFGFPQTHLFGDDSVVQQAKRYFEAGDYDRAEQLYQSQLNQPLSDWQQRILHYNLATVMMIKKEWNKALSQYLLADYPTGLPLLQQRLTNNVALARLMLAKESIEAVDSQKAKNPTAYLEIFTLLEDMIIDIKVAKQANCNLQYAEGASECVESEEIQNIEKQAKEISMLWINFFEGYRSQLPQIHPDKNSLMESLEQLANDYRLVLIQEPILESGLTLLGQHQDQISEVMKESGSTEVKSRFDLTQERLKNGRNQLSESHLLLARIYVDAAYDSIVLLIQSLSPLLKTHAENVLEQTIDQQRLALRMIRMQELIDDDVVLPADLRAFPVRMQIEVIRLADEFLKVAVVEQKSEFKNDQLEVKRPWEEVISLFITGREFAMQAQSNLKTPTRDSSTARTLEERALYYWIEALSKLKTQSSSATSSQAESSNSTQKQSQQQNAQFNNTARLLQEMENEDKSKPLLKIGPEPRGDERPW